MDIYIYKDIYIYIHIPIHIYIYPRQIHITLLVIGLYPSPVLIPLYRTAIFSPNHSTPIVVGFMPTQFLHMIPH